ncbi:MAG TPA: hypothetical protein PLA11_16340 [Flavobacteriales bacterium]|nr:hypothetical protein [Flavobacteriales bacterium]MCB9167816.1 hypothetical protein [Flavobacteriales bacterium]HOP45093.1 hypothetical protein [Flavobacteriales bacterium]
MTFKRYVPLQEFNCITRDFTDHIKLRPLTAPVDMGIRSLRFKVAELLAALVDPATCEPEKGWIRGVVVHLGLDPSDRFDVAIQFVCLVPTEEEDTYTYTVPENYYTVGTDKLIAATDTLEDWLDDRGDRYMANMVVRRTDGPDWSAFNAEVDVRSVVFPYEGCLQQLIADNDMGNGDLMELKCMSEPTHWSAEEDPISQEGFHHSVVWLGAEEELDDDTYTQPFLHKAADMGVTIPPGSAAAGVVLRTTGLPRRPGC